MSGLRPVTYTIAPFNTIRCLEQIKIDVCYQGLPVVIVGVGGGLAYASLGATHHALDDVAAMRALPDMTVLCPCDAVEARLALRAALELSGPCYIRLGKKNEPLVHPAGYDFAVGRWPLLRPGTDACLIASGAMVHIALAAAGLLAERGVEVRVLDAHTVKPLDRAALDAALAGTGLVCALEEHSLIGGLSSAVAEYLCDAQTMGRIPKTARLLRLGVPDAFLHSIGGQSRARTALGLDAPGVAAAVADALGRSGGEPDPA